MEYRIQRCKKEIKERVGRKMWVRVIEIEQVIESLFEVSVSKYNYYKGTHD